jgi:hypothetical protein
MPEPRDLVCVAAGIRPKNPEIQEMDREWLILSQCSVTSAR